MTATIAPPPDPTPTSARKPRSGGPRTQAGKDIAKRNALRHGMRAKVVFPEDLAAVIAERSGQFVDEFRPANPYEAWLIDQVAIHTTLLDRCAELTIADLGRRVVRAERFWEQDRRDSVEALGAKLTRNPSRTVVALRRTMQGAEWLIERWTALGKILHRAGGWDETQMGLAFDLLGTPPELRAGSALLPPDADLATLSDLVENQVAGLRALQAEALDDLDAEDREQTQLGIPVDEDGPTLLLRRYEADCRRSLRWALAEFHRVRSGSAPAANPRAPIASPPPPCPALPPRPVEEPVPALASVLSRLAATFAPADIEPADEPEAAPVPAVTQPAAVHPLSRRARREKEKQARLAAKRAAKLAKQSR